VLLSLQDQGLTGADGLAKVARDPLTDAPGVRINITIVAVNVAPTISAAASIQVVENEMYSFSRGVLDADDGDADEVITSGLAIENWLGMQWNSPYLNKIRVTLELQGYGNRKGRGLLYFDAAATQITIVSNASHFFASVVPLFPEHDTCAAWPFLNRPPVHACDTGSSPLAVGKSCSGPQDLQTCNVLGTGTFVLGNLTQNSTTVTLLSSIRNLALLASSPEGITMKIVSGIGQGLSFKILSAAGSTVTLETALGMDLDATSVWSIVLSLPHCQNVGIELSSVCVRSQGTKGQTNSAGSRCPDVNCTCVFENTCNQDGKILLYLNRSNNNLAVQQYFQQITSSFAVYRMTCGAMPTYRGLNFSLGKPCSSDADCNQKKFKKCVPGISCRCCSNITAICTVNADCQQYQSGSMCGCERGLSPPVSDKPIQYSCCANLSAVCTSDVQCRAFANDSHCGCIMGFGICNDSLGIGNPCTYRGIAQQKADGAYLMYPSTTCQAPLYSYEGTENARIFNQLAFDSIGFKSKDGVFNSQGSTRIEYYAPRRFAVIAIRSIKYLTNSPIFPNYNRLYRIPERDRDPATFEIAADDYDQLYITVNDMGNSGGGIRDIQQVSALSKIVAAARNNAPFVTGPSSIVANEDVPRYIINAIRINDPDESDNGFNDSLITADHLDGMGFIVNLTVQHGCLFINEQFFRTGKEYAERGTGLPILGNPQCSLVAQFGINGINACTIRLKDYGQPKYGLHAVKCEDITSGCPNSVSAPCVSYLNAAQQPWCYARMCTKFLSFEGRFPDVNQVLSNITYLSDPNFNTYFGYSEQLLIEVTDNGIIGDIINPLSSSLVIPIEVMPVNDPPVIGRLQTQQCITFNDDGSVNFNKPNSEERVFRINNEFDFIDVNENTMFTLYPDRVWIMDNDAEEAVIRSTYISECEGDCAAPFDQVAGCCQKQNCPNLCAKISRSSRAALPSQILVSFSVDNGYISFYPPSTRPMLSGLDFLTNLSLVDLSNGGEIDLCPVQVKCMQNQTRIWIRTKISILQNALRWGYLTFSGADNFVGNIQLKIWVSDDGYSDVNLTNTLIATDMLIIQVIPVNNAPVVLAPTGTGCLCSATNGICNCGQVPPLQFSSGFRCYNNWMDFSLLEVNAVLCGFPNISRIPNQRDSYQGFPDLGQNIQISDVDFQQDVSSYVTVELVLGRKGVGGFFLYETLTTVEYFQWVENDELVHLRMNGELRDINYQMTKLFLDIKPDYSGPAPIQVNVNDNKFAGVCTPSASIDPYACKRSNCKNSYGESTLGEIGYFICKQPVAGEGSMYSFIPAGQQSCSQIDGNLPASNLRWSTGLWSGPFSCLGCGYYDPETKVITGTDEPPVLLPRLAVTNIQAVVIGASACQFPTCLSCNAAAKYLAGPFGDGCGWCPSFCGGRGKCMIGISGPIFEICPPDPKTGLKYRQCIPVPLNLPLILGTSIPAAHVIFALIYVFFRWVRKRHGSLSVYIRKKRFDVMHHGRNLHLVPPATASYFEFAVTVILALIIGILFGGVLETQSGPFFFQQEFYLDASNRIQFNVDNCNLRFVPTRNYPFPISAISALKIRFAYYINPDILLNADTCSASATFEVLNDLNPSMKYKEFYCNIEVLVPDRYIMPTLVVNALGSNQTTVRSGPMDDDTKHFGLEFGPNEFILQGGTISARLENITALHFKFDVLHGDLLLTNIYQTSFGTFNTLDADIVVTSPIQTSANVWQKSEDLVCLSAASLYVDSNCKRICAYAPQGKTAQTTASVDFRYIDQYYRRRLLQSTTTCPINVPGCTNSDCSLVQSDQCLCKPVCDMVSAQNLDFNGVKGIKGTCNGEGKCCRTICQGYSSADLFPFPNTVRCGICQDQTACSLPTCGQWSPGGLNQQFWFTSERGQISLAVFDSSIDSSKGLHSFKGSAPASTVNVPVGFNEEDSVLLAELFHPGGKSNPLQQWFWLRINGPGSPPTSFGNFAWLLSLRYIVLPSYFLQVVSYSTLNPKKGAAAVRLRPGFCPAYIDYKTSALANTRIIKLYQLLSDLLQKPSGGSFPFPFGSLIVWIPSRDLPTKLDLDPSTNTLGFSVINLWFGAGAELFLTLLLASIFPLAGAFVLVAIIGYKLKHYINARRKKKVAEAAVKLNLFEHMRIAKLDAAERAMEEEIDANSPEFIELRGQIDVWYLIDCCFADPDKQRPFLAKFGRVCCHLAIVGGPILFLTFLADTWNSGKNNYFCENRIDKANCFAQSDPFADAVNWFMLVFALFSVIDLSCHYLTVRYFTFRTLLRNIYYAMLGFVAWLFFSATFLTAAWILLGAMQQPVLLGPFGLSGVCCYVVTLQYFRQQRRFFKLIRQSLDDRVHIKRAELEARNTKIPADLVSFLIQVNLEHATIQQGYSSARILGRTFILLSTTIAVYCFVLIGFQAFVDFNNYWEGLLNSCIVVLLPYLILALFQGPDASWEKIEADHVAENILGSMDILFQSMENQLDIAQQIIDSIPREGLEQLEAQDASSSETEEIDNDQVPLLVIRNE